MPKSMYLRETLYSFTSFPEQSGSLRLEDLFLLLAPWTMVSWREECDALLQNENQMVLDALVVHLQKTKWTGSEGISD